VNGGRPEQGGNQFRLSSSSSSSSSNLLRSKSEDENEDENEDNKNKKAFIPAKQRMKALSESHSRTSGMGWPHPSLDGEVGRTESKDSDDRDERKSNRYPDFGLNLAPAFPIE
jgi:hypothetical protein